ncbi:hypothetical protein [Paracraurococcus lichenis]|uniref:Uncharacterized protein n=1 Tax=Paracraurococcus lichenis TaxID=3064888 RepID=A0ABT9DW79_9PROT|nr:hypothetical protein [Paracraurococcus sp. LOR1-02]MDO9708151.1 hypothetical protein [Paracraurococcus sp. LOR1-02]
MQAAALAAALRALSARLPMAEPPEAALAAEAWRQSWRPARVRLLLLAESHMATSAAELAMPLRLPVALDWPVPAGFVRHVYCPAYGEPALVPGLPVRNAGTPQYWRLLAALEGSAPPTRASHPALAARLAARAALLHRLRRRGIWLTDAALAAVAGPGGQRAGAAAHAEAIRESWRLHHGTMLPALDPAGVVVIGRAVAAVLRPALDAAFPGRWQAVPQPMGARGRAATAALHATLAEAARRHAPAAAGMTGTGTD